MIEQIINYLRENSFLILVFLPLLVYTGLTIYVRFVIPFKIRIKNKQKTTTQKYREGLIKK